MAENFEVLSSGNDKILENSYDDPSIEPGASKETMLLTVDSFEEIKEQSESQNNERKRSGTISEIESADDPKHVQDSWTPNSVRSP